MGRTLASAKAGKMIGFWEAVELICQILRLTSALVKEVKEVKEVKDTCNAMRH